MSIDVRLLLNCKKKLDNVRQQDVKCIQRDQYCFQLKTSVFNLWQKTKVSDQVTCGRLTFKYNSNYLLLSGWVCCIRAKYYIYMYIDFKYSMWTWYPSPLKFVKTKSLKKWGKNSHIHILSKKIIEEHS